jgi:predicted nucleic acid-binding protein
MIVISDTSPLNYLISIGQIQLLHDLFGQVVIAKAVLEELQSEDAPEEVHQWIRNRPAWLEIREIDRKDLKENVKIEGLDRGEQESILLAHQLKADLVLLDERKGRIAAKDLGLNIVGTIGILDQAAKRGLIDLAIVVEDLRRTNFRIRKDLLNALLKQS